MVFSLLSLIIVVNRLGDIGNVIDQRSLNYLVKQGQEIDLDAQGIMVKVRVEDMTHAGGSAS